MILAFNLSKIGHSVCLKFDHSEQAPLSQIFTSFKKPELKIISSDTLLVSSTKTFDSLQSYFHSQKSLMTIT